MEQITQLFQIDWRAEAVGLIGGVLFFGSWLLQAWESRRAGKSVVSTRFFVIRSLASALLAIEGLRTGSFSVFAVMAATLILMLYNLRLSLKNSAA
ncbi:lipid-A-disaccharide synthase N-terminal domain-containing protein [Pseudooceanicola onchidii]|uniref:lipid-A-disaccharide synthase N-terminal domain-containing protein n=1 Tax=Pseudooceanicola onchidii TaxID=2562279 RepID=UPI0010A9F6AF|nr:lipid-A-disaccharide synthase N-terminal domain-containing protein [Pseudooceanicola onchidii]